MLRSLRARLTVLMIVLVLLPLIVVGIVLTLRAQDVQRDQAQEIEFARAQTLALQLQMPLQRNIQQLNVLAQVGELAGLPPDVQETALYELMIYEDSLNEIALLDASGQEIIYQKRGALVPDEDLTLRATSDEFRQPFEQRAPYIGPVEMDTLTGVPALKIAVPVIDRETDRVVNVLVAQYSLIKVWDALAANPSEEGHQAYLVDDGGRVVAHENSAVVLNGKTFTLPTDIGQSYLGTTTGLSGDEVVMAVLPYSFGGHVVSVVTERTVSEALKPAYETRTIMILFTLITTVVAALVATLLLTRLTSPLATLAAAARRLGTGDFTVRAEEKGGSELVAVSHAFNEMAGQLATTVDTLEQRITARTSDLQLASNLSSQIATILEPERLLPEVVELTKSNFDLYHAHLYLLDTATNYLRLTAGAGDVGRIMLERGHRIALNAQSLVARAARENVPVVVNDVVNEKNFLRNPLLPETRSEAALPLAVRGHVVGVLDVQSDQIGRFDHDLQSVLQTMAGQVAVAIANAQLFSETERTSRREAALGAITEAIQGARTIDDVLQTAARELGKALGVSHTSIELSMADAPGKTKPPAQTPTESKPV